MVTTSVSDAPDWFRNARKNSASLLIEAVCYVDERFSRYYDVDPQLAEQLVGWYYCEHMSFASRCAVVRRYLWLLVQDGPFAIFGTTLDHLSNPITALSAIALGIPIFCAPS